MQFGVYVHFPYCAARCPYCDFAIAVRKDIRHDRYLDAITAELAAKAPLYRDRSAVSIYFGGGTPSLWQTDCVAAAVALIRRSFPAPDGVTQEVTLECDPADIDEKHLSELSAAGVNRLSIGAQSFSRRHLRVLGRRHIPNQIAATVTAARAAGFRNVSLDLMIGLCGQRPSELESDLAQLVALSPEHVSLYQLTVEPKTPLGAAVRRGSTKGPDERAQAAAYERVCTALATSGYTHYEISNFARRTQDKEPALHSRHNSLYWTGGEYLGLGMGAHSFRRQRGGQRFANARGLDAYLSLWSQPDSPSSFALESNAPGLAIYEELSPAQLAREALWLSLRRVAGFSTRWFHDEYGIDPLTEYANEIAAMQARGWLVAEKDWLRLSTEGLLFADEVGAAFL